MVLCGRLIKNNPFILKEVDKKILKKISLLMSQ